MAEYSENAYVIWRWELATIKPKDLGPTNPKVLTFFDDSFFGKPSRSCLSDMRCRLRAQWFFFWLVFWPVDRSLQRRKLKSSECYHGTIGEQDRWGDRQWCRHSLVTVALGHSPTFLHAHLRLEDIYSDCYSGLHCSGCYYLRFVIWCPVRNELSNPTSCSDSSKWAEVELETYPLSLRWNQCVWCLFVKLVKSLAVRLS